MIKLLNYIIVKLLQTVNALLILAGPLILLALLLMLLSWPFALLVT